VEDPLLRFVVGIGIGTEHSSTWCPIFFCPNYSPSLWGPESGVNYRASPHQDRLLKRAEPEQFQEQSLLENALITYGALKYRVAHLYSQCAKVCDYPKSLATDFVVLSLI